MFAPHPEPKVLRSFFKSDRLPMRRFLFGNFFFCAFGFKKKSGFPLWVSKNLCTDKKLQFTRYKLFLFISQPFYKAQTVTPLFLFDAKGAKRKSSRKRKTPMRLRARDCRFLKKAPQKLLARGAVRTYLQTIIYLYPTTTRKKGAVSSLGMISI